MIIPLCPTHLEPLAGSTCHLGHEVPVGHEATVDSPEGERET